MGLCERCRHHQPGCDKDDLKECLPASCYQESMLLEYAKKIINDHDPSTPLFLTYASELVHPPLEITRWAMDSEEQVQKFFSKYVGFERKVNWTKRRKRMSASLLYLDFVFGRLAQALKDRNMYEDTLIIFISDNGAGTHLRAAGALMSIGLLLVDAASPTLAT